MKVDERDPGGGLIFTATDARDLADIVRDRMKRGLDVDGYLTARINGQTHDAAVELGKSTSARETGAWTFATLAERFIADHVSQPKVRRNGSVKPAKDRTIAEVRSILRHADVVAALDRELARDVRKRDVDAIRDAWWHADAKGRQHKLVTYVKSAFKWAKQNHSAAQLDDVAPWWLELRHHRYASQAEMESAAGEAPVQPLTAREVATLLHVAERNRVSPERANRSETREVTLAALWWVALTAQRTHAAFQVRTSRVEDRTATDGWWDVSWIPLDMKAGRHFSLAVPPEIYERTIGRALHDPHRRSASVWVFPMRNEKVKGKEERADRPINDNALNNLLGRLRGLKNAKQASSDQIADAGLPRFKLHEVRDALATHLASHTDLPASAASAILDHSSGEVPDAREAAVTRDHYNKSQRMALKFAGLKAWAEAVLTEYDRIHRNYQRELTAQNALRRPRPPSRREKERLQAALERQAAAIRADAPTPQDAPVKRQPLNLSLLKQEVETADVEGEGA